MEKIIDMINNGKVEDVSLQNLVLQVTKFKKYKSWHPKAR